jgi:hypothetical protein
LLGLSLEIVYFEMGNRYFKFTDGRNQQHVLYVAVLLLMMRSLRIF